MKTFKYDHHVFAALNNLNVTYYTSPVDYIVVQYGGSWMPYTEFQGLKAYNHLPEVNLNQIKEVV